MGDNGQLMTGIDYNIIFNTYQGLGFMSWTTKKSSGGHWVQVVATEGSNKLIPDGCWKFWHRAGADYNIRNNSAPAHSFMATSASTGDATADSLYTEISPNTSTNKLGGNGSWRIEGTPDAYNLVNSEFNQGSNFLSYSSTAAGSSTTR